MTDATTSAAAPAPAATSSAVSGVASGIDAGIKADVAAVEADASSFWTKAKPYVIPAATFVAGLLLGHFAH
jgi:hypothetical protein